MGEFNHAIGLYVLEKGIVKQKKKHDLDEALHIQTKNDLNEQESFLVLEKIATPENLNKLREINLLLTREKMRQSISPDMVILNTINNIEELAKMGNTTAKRTREWFNLYLPEAERLDDNEAFVKIVSQKDKKTIMQELKVNESIGAEPSKEDMKPIIELANLSLEIFRQKSAFENHLDDLMEKLCPNIKAVTGSLIGAKLLREAGSLEKLSKMTSTTVQMLGAEAALFRHLRNKRAPPPKHGHIINHPLLQKAKKADKGKAARAIADKTSMAAKIDFFKGEYLGDKLRKDLEKKIK